MSPTSPRQPGAGGARQQATAPFKVHRESHLIHKQGAAGAGASSSSPPSSSSTNSSVSSSPGAATSATNYNSGGGAGQQRPAPRPRQQQPVIIYTHSPKVIRTSPRDFMSIVQKLTGLESVSAAAASAVTAAAAQDESSSSSTESCANANSHAHAAAPAPPGHYMDPQLMPPPTAPLDHAHFMPDIPLFAPGASEQQLLCASRGLYGQFPPAVDATAALGPAVNIHGGGGVFSPSMVEAMRTTFPDFQ